MCRLYARVGTPRTLLEQVVGAPHSLEVQSYKPKMMDEATLNADGFGLAWYNGQDAEPARYRSTLPLWSDENFRGFGGQVRSSHVLAYVRSATRNIGAGLANTQPFVHGKFAFMHNGYLKDFRDGAMRRMQRQLGDEAFGLIRGSSDSEHLFALFMDAIFTGASMLDALRAVVEGAETAVEGKRALLVLMASDGERIHALRTGLNGAKTPTLFSRDEPGGGCFASEPLDDDDTWIPIEDGGYTTIDTGGVSHGT